MREADYYCQKCKAKLTVGERWEGQGIATDDGTISKTIAQPHEPCGFVLFVLDDASIREITK